MSTLITLFVRRGSNSRTRSACCFQVRKSLGKDNFQFLDVFTVYSLYILYNEVGVGWGRGGWGL